MSNQQLLILYNYEIAELTTEARSLLISELDERGINPVNDYKAEDSFYLSSVNSIQQLSPEIRFFIAEILEKGCDRGYLTGGLLERGLTDQEAEDTLKLLSPYYLKQTRNNGDALLRGIFISTAGIAMQALPLNKESHLAIIIFSYVITLFGVLSSFHQLQLKRRLQSILRTLKTLDL
jgi:hypothetical protein